MTYNFPNSIEYTKDADDEEEFIIESILPASSVTIITGREGTGKTWLAMSAARAVAKGEPFLDQYVKQGSVLYMNLDRMLILNVRSRLEHLSPNKTLEPWSKNIYWQDGDFNILGIEIDPETNIALTDDMNQPIYKKERLKRYIQQNNIKLVIIDTFHKLTTSANLNEDNSSDMDKICIAVRDIARKTGAAIIMLHHTPVMDDTRGRGSGAISATVDQVISLQGNIKEKLTITNGKTRGMNISIFPIVITDYITLNPIPEGAENEPVGALKAVLDQNVQNIEGTQRIREINYKIFEKWIWANGERTSDTSRTAHRITLIELFGGNERNGEYIVNYCKDHFKKLGRLEIIGKKSSTRYILHY